MGENLNALTGNPAASDIVGTMVEEQGGEPVSEQETSMETEQEMEPPASQEGVSDEGAQDWETEAKKFQSLYDKTKSDLDKAMPIINTLTQRPDIVEAVGTMLTSESRESEGSNSNQNEVTKEDYDPWDAGTEPNSVSYQHQQSRIDKRVDERMEQKMEGIRRKEAISELKGKMKSDYNMSDNEAGDFIEFVTKPKAEHTVDDLQQLWRITRGRVAGEPSENIKVARETQKQPMPAGVLQGGEPARQSDEQAVIDGVVAAAKRGRTQW